MADSVNALCIQYSYCTETDPEPRFILHLQISSWPNCVFMSVSWLLLKYSKINIFYLSVCLFVSQIHRCGPRTTCGSGWSGPLRSMAWWRSTRPCFRPRMARSCARWARRTSWGSPQPTTPRSCFHISITSGTVSVNHHLCPPITTV